MATAHTEPKPGGSILDVMTTQIREVFERILSEVRSRRDELLAQVSKIRTEFEGKNASMIENLKELEEMRAYVEKMSVKQNLAMKKQQESLADIDAEIGKLKDSLNQNSSFKFNFTINQLITQVKQFGEIVNESHLASIYSKKLTAVRVIDGYKDIQFRGPNILHIDYDKELLYVVCREKNDVIFPVAIFNAKDFSFITGFGDSSYPHTCIATSKEFIYFGSLRDRYTCDMLLQYKQSDYSLVKTITINTKCSNIAVTSENQVIVLCHTKSNFLFRTYDRALNFKKEIDLNIESGSPVRLPIQQREDLFYILHNKQLLVFNREGKNIETLDYIKEESRIIVPTTESFYLDEAGNIIFTDSRTNSIKFFSPAGDLFHTIGEDTVGSDEVKDVIDIIAFKGKVIVCCGVFYGPKTIRIY